MKTTFLTSLALVAFGMFASTGRADHEHARFRTFDDLAFSSLISARELRWEIHDDFAASRSYNHLLRDADTLMEHLRDLQTLIYRESSNRTIHHHVDTVIAHVADMRRCLLESDYARGGIAPHTTFNNPGVLFNGGPRPNPCRVHVDVALGHLAQVDANLQSLCMILSGRSIPPVIMPYNLSVPPANGTGLPGGTVPMSPNVSPVPSQGPVGPALGPVNGTNFRQNGHDHKFVEQPDRPSSSKRMEIPVSGKNGNIVLRFGK